MFKPEIEDFLTTLALCHTVTITGSSKKSKKNDEDIGLENTAFDFQRGEYEYQASSPDEKALTEACQRYSLEMAKI